MISCNCNSTDNNKDETINHKCCRNLNINKLEVYDWNKDLPIPLYNTDIVEVRFKNTRKLFFHNSGNIPLSIGDIVAVEANPGHDIGVVSLTGVLVLEQMKKHNISKDSADIKKIYRKAKQIDLDKWFESIMLEPKALVRSREIAQSLKLEMKIGDVEYQGDKTKAYFYYIADERVDFRELIKGIAESMRIRVEMKQIGSRQEAGRIGGLSSCGRELCCSTWLTDFKTVSTNAARQQDLSYNPIKLAGQCGKLKCCINYEVDCYIDAMKEFPKHSQVLETIEGPAYYQKADIFRKIAWYSFDKNTGVNITPVSIERINEIIELNKKGIKVDKLIDVNVELAPTEKVLGYDNVVGNDSITRFDKKNRNQKKKNNRKRYGPEKKK